MIFFIQLLLQITTAQAYLGLLTDGDVLPKDEYSVGAETQLVFNKNDGLNFAGHYAMGITDSIEMLVDAGFGAVDAYGGASVKVVPYPDYDKQPAIGFILGAVYAHEASEDFLTLHTKAFVSKSFEFDYGKIVPYGALSFGYTMTNIKGAENPFHLILGAKYQHFEWKKIYLYGELGTSLSEAFNYVSLKINFPLDFSENPLDAIE